jgi:hypothetical protein
MVEKQIIILLVEMTIKTVSNIKSEGKIVNIRILVFHYATGPFLLVSRMTLL